MPDDELTSILIRLEAAHQRATYGAVAGKLKVPAMFLMNGRPRDPLHSWVVSTRDGTPTGYLPDQQHPDLFRQTHVIRTTAELERFLDEQETRA
jgi:hypothetical protein